MHDPDRDPRIKYDSNAPLRHRKLSPEYAFVTSYGELRCIATFQPKPHYDSETRIFNLSNIDILARDFNLSPSRHIPTSVLENIKRQYDVR
jgi:hypothetical protein